MHHTQGHSLRGVLRVQVLTEAYRRGAVQKQRTEAMALKARMEMAKIARMRAAKRKMDAEASTFDRCVACGPSLLFAPLCMTVGQRGSVCRCMEVCLLCMGEWTWGEEGHEGEVG